MTVNYCSSSNPLVRAGADALRTAFPTLEQDYTLMWFDKAAAIVLKAAGAIE